jgi:tyrosine-protein kinase Etk/Wzc
MKYISILDYFVVLAKYKKFIVRFVASCVVLTAILLFVILSRWYKSTAVVIPPKQKSMSSLMTSLSRTTSSLRALGLGAQDDDIAQFRTILASRRVKEDVIKKFDLMKVYDLETMEKTIKELEDNISVELGKEDVSLEINVFDTQPQRAAEIANYFVDRLNTVYLEISVSEAASNRKFLEARYKRNLEDLNSAQERYQKFQEKYSAYSATDQVKAAIEVAAKLQAQIVLKEVELGIIERTSTPENEMRRNVKIELDELQRQMKNMKYGSPSKGRNAQIFAPFEQVPEIGIQYLDRYREMEIQGKIMELLVPIYEQAKIEEQRNTPSVLVLDVAVPAVKSTKPKRVLLLVISFFASILIASLISFGYASFHEKRGQFDESDTDKLNYLLREFHWRNILR